MKGSATALFLVCLLTSTSLQAQEAKNADQAALEEKMCAETKCQRDLVVTLKRKDAETYSQNFKVFPAIVQPYGVMVVAGQTVNIEADIADGKLTNLVAVEIVSHPEKTITATLEQSEDGGMMLVVSNPFPKILKFNMGMMPLDKEKLLKTSSCPIIAGGKIFEMWPFPIFQIALGNGRFLEINDAMTCE